MMRPNVNPSLDLNTNTLISVIILNWLRPNNIKELIKAAVIYTFHTINS